MHKLKEKVNCINVKVFDKSDYKHSV